MVETNRDLLIGKIQETYSLSERAAAYHADKLLLELPEKFWENLQEWVDGRPFTDIRQGKYSIPLIMHIRNNRDFLDACYTMVEYCRDEENGERQIWRTVK